MIPFLFVTPAKAARQRGPRTGQLGVRNQNTVLESLLKALPRRVFGGIVERHRGDRYIKEFSSWDHLVALVFAQLARIGSLRELAAVWNG